MNHTQHIKANIHHYHHEIFRDSKKMEPLSANTHATWYIVLSGQQAPAQLYKKQKNKYICTAFTNAQQKCCYLAIQGQFYHHYIASLLQKNKDLIITEQEIIVLITSICQAFAYLRQCQCSHKLTNYKQYSIVKLYNCTGYKLLYHQSMISQFDIAKNNDINWYELYLSPEEINGQFVQQKSIVFSFGVMLLNLCTLADRNRIIYDIDQFGIDEQIIEDKLDMAKNKYGYSNILCNFIQLCLNMRHEQRPDFLELKQCFTRKLHRKYQRQSQFLSQFAKFQSTKGISYNIILPSLSKSSNQKSNKNIISQASAVNISEFKLNLEQTIVNQNQNEKKIKKKPSSKFQKVKSNTKTKQVKQQTQQTQLKQLQKKIQQKQKQKQQKLPNFNIQYRGTFGDRHIIPSKTEGQNNGKKIKKSKKQSLQDIDEQVKPYVNKQQVKQTQKITIYQKIQQKTQLPKMQKNKNNLTISITHKQTNKGQQVETPKGFGQYSFENSFTIEDYNKMFYNQMVDIQDLPRLITQMKYLKLQQCLLSIQDIIKNMKKVGVWVEGDLYYGDFLHGRRDGLGLEIFSNGEYYFGYFKEDLFTDQGFYFWNQRQYFFGKFELGQKVWGRLEGEIKYQGAFKDNKRSGFGTCWYASGQIYSGKWFNGKKHGKGYLFEPDGSKFVGNWVKGKKKGSGQLSTETMTILGHWNQQNVEGQAQIRYSNGDIFIGKIGPIFEKIVGQYISKSGRRFIGEFQNDQPKKGQLKYSNGDKYVGQLKNMKRHGYGEYFYSSGEVYKGLWENNSKKQQK